MRAAFAALFALAACAPAESVDLSVRFGSRSCPDVADHCAIERRGRGVLVASAAPGARDPEPLAPEADMLTFYGEVATASGATAVIEIAYGNDGNARRLRYREVGEGHITFRGEVKNPRGRAGANPGEPWTFSFVAEDSEAKQPARIISGAIRPVGVIVANETEPESDDESGCGGEVDTYPDPYPYPGPYYPVPDPDPDPDPGPGPGPDPDPDPDPDPIDPWPSSAPSTDTGCEGDTTSSASSDGCEGDTTSSASSDGCEGDTSSSSASSGCSDCEGGDVAAASCVPLLPLERIILSLFRLFWPATLVGAWNRRARRRLSPK